MAEAPVEGPAEVGDARRDGGSDVVERGGGVVVGPGGVSNGELFVVSGIMGHGTYLTSLLGSRSLSSAWKPFRMSPLNEGTCLPLRFSMGLERGLAYWPAMRPMRTTRLLAPQSSTKLICRSSLILDSMAFCSQ
jgi:hypothetical protein